MIRVPIALDTPDDVLATAAFGAGALIRVERSATEGGVYAEVTTIPVVAGTYAYDYWDPAGTATSWYRWRVSNAGNTQQSGYSDAFQGVDVAAEIPDDAYATIGDLLKGVDQNITNTRLLSRYSDALVESAAEIDEEVGHDFHRHPRSGTETRTFTGSGRARICVHGDIAGIVPGTVTAIEVSTSRSAPVWEALGVTHYELEPSNPVNGAPHDHILLTGAGDYAHWPLLVRVTAAFGWAEIPKNARKANVARARQSMGADLSGPGGVVGPEELGRQVGPDRLPDAMYRFLLTEKRRHIGCSM